MGRSSSWPGGFIIIGCFGYWLLVAIGRWLLLVVGCYWLLVTIGCWLLLVVCCYWLLPGGLCCWRTGRSSLSRTPSRHHSRSRRHISLDVSHHFTYSLHVLHNGASGN